MTKVDIEKQQHYNAKIRIYEGNVTTLKRAEADMLSDCRAKPQEAACKLFYLSDNMLNLTSNYLVINGITNSVLGSKNEDALNDAKLNLSKAIIYLENVVTGKVDAPYSEYEGNLSELTNISCEKKFYMVKKIGITLDLLEQAYGDNTKWRWTFVDLEGKFAAVAKNLLDLKKAQANNDPNSPDYEPVLSHIYFVKRSLGKVADRFHERFELSTRRKEDLRSGINFLNALKRILLVLGDRSTAEQISKKAENWNTVFDHA
ncbi:MAG: hypothetical protein Ta2F_02830 [Termitinemataceae bacterium]|nr:MAG: hypothetical protein Ta2F_02830 [Termitinemataceae bacterium]